MSNVVKSIFAIVAIICVFLLCSSFCLSSGISSFYIGRNNIDDETKTFGTPIETTRKLPPLML